MATSGDSQDETTLRLNIANSQQLCQFLREIQPQFLRVVDPRESGLLDILCAAQLLTETDQESLSGKDVHTRKDQTRKLWFLLNKMAVDDFLSKVSPVLIREFPHIIPHRFLTQEAVDVTISEADCKYCLRHDITGRIRAATMADLLYHNDRLKLEDYEDIASEEFEADIVWTKMFHSCQNDQQNSPSLLVQDLQALLKKYKVQVPENLAELVSRGVPCTCSVGDADDVLLPAASPLLSRKVGSWVKKSPFGCSSPRSSGSSYRSYSSATSIRDVESQSLSSEDTLVPDHVTTFPAQQHSSMSYGRHLSMVCEQDEDPSTESPASSLPDENSKAGPSEGTSPSDSQGHQEKKADQSESSVSLAIDHEGSCENIDNPKLPLLSADSEGTFVPISFSLCCLSLPFHVLQRVDDDVEEGKDGLDAEAAALRRSKIAGIKKSGYRYSPVGGCLWDFLPSPLKVFVGIWFCGSALLMAYGFFSWVAYMRM